MIVELILDSDGDHFLFSPIFDRTPVSRDLDCHSLAKISEILAGADILSDANIFDVFCMAGRTISRYSAGDNPPIKAVQPAITAHLATTCGGINTFWEKWETVRSGRCCGLCRAKTVRRCFHACANILLKRIFCRHQHFVNANFFVGANILSM